MTRRLAVAIPVALACAAGAAWGVGAGVETLRPVTILELTNTSRARAFAIPVASGSAFSVTYHHSMYDQPVTEEFAVAPNGDLVLQAVSSPSAAVREYFGITAAGERHRVVRSMPEIVFRVAAGTPQRLSVGGVERSFLTLGAPGDRLLMRAVCRPGFACALLDRRGGRNRIAHR
jgi:hypothetical protein